MPPYIRDEIELGPTDERAARVDSAPPEHALFLLPKTMSKRTRCPSPLLCSRRFTRHFS